MGEKLTAHYCLDNNIPYCAGRIFSFYSNSQSNDYLYPAVKKTGLYPIFFRQW